MSTLLGSPARVAGLVTVLAVAAVGAAGLVGPPESVVRERPPRVEPVVRTTTVCPFVGGEQDAVSQVGVMVLPGVTAGEPGRPGGSASDPAVEVLPLLGEEADPEPLLEVTERGVPEVAAVEADEPRGHVVRATGSLAAGVVAEQSLLASGADLRGLADAACAEPAREHWFVGASGEVGRRARLVLSNPSDSPAVADVTVWDEAGPIDTPGAADLGVPARGQRVVLLDALAPESGRVGLRVSVAEGRLAAAVEVRETAGLDPEGISAVPAATAPATRLVVPGVPGRGQRLLRLLAPGDSDAIVSLRLLGADGPFSPAGQDVVTVTAGTVAEVPIGDAAGEVPVAVEVTSDVPVTGSVRIVDSPEEGGPDLAYTSAVPALTGPAATLLGRSGAGVSTSLLLSGTGDEPGRVEVATLDGSGGAGASQVVDVPVGATVAVPLEAAEGADRVIVVVTPEQDGTVSAARLSVGGDGGGALIDVVPLTTPRLTVAVPEVAGELPTGLLPPTREELQ